MDKPSAFLTGFVVLVVGAVLTGFVLIGYRTASDNNRKNREFVNSCLASGKSVINGSLCLPVYQAPPS